VVIPVIDQTEVIEQKLEMPTEVIPQLVDDKPIDQVVNEEVKE